MYDQIMLENIKYFISNKNTVQLSNIIIINYVKLNYIAKKIQNSKL